MAIEAVLGLDVGTTTVKALLVDRTGSVVGSGSSDLIATRSPETGGAEQDLSEIWDAVVTSVRRATRSSDDDIAVSGISMAAQSGSVCPVGSDNKPCGPVVTWMDSRSAQTVNSWSDERHR
ncbi:MAG TPA: FGGY family carbohydrate kinase, partial [Acidimicrobiales bacterium]|nr:FGGY family carbohydrate kinase [Acidimicrobiales bacterium]